MFFLSKLLPKHTKSALHFMFTHREHVLKRATTYIILFYTKFSFKRAIFKRNLVIHKKQIAPFFKKK